MYCYSHENGSGIVVMEIIEKMACAGCFLGIAVSAADIIKPDDRFSTHIKMLFSVMFILAFLSPVINGDIPEILQSSISTNSEVSYTGLDKACENEMKRFVEKNIARSLSELMESEGITYDEIFVNVNINEDSSIDISEINIKSDNFCEAEEFIKNEIGKEVLVYEKSETEDTG